MKHLFKPRVSGLLMTFLLLAGGTQTALAAGTASSTPINNTATVNYEVDSVVQTPVLSSPLGDTPTGIATTFLVDNKVDLTVVASDVAYVTVVPGSTSQVLTFTVTNDGNTTQDFSLVAALGVDPFGGTANFGAAVTAVYVESSAIPDGFQSGVDVATYIDELAADGTVTVYVVSDIPVIRVNGDIAAYTLTADAANAGLSGSLGAATSATAGADDATVVDVVLADAAGDTDAQYFGDHSDTSAYRVVTAALAVAKTSLVISDPFNGVSSPKAIPGATMGYTITVTNTGVPADNVVVTDPIPTNTTLVGGSVVATGTGLVAYSEDNTVTWIAAPTGLAVVTHIRATFANIGDGTVTPQVATVTFQVTID